jgi:uncharacterized cupin superfamily protein
VKAFNLFDGELDLERDRPGFSWRRAMVGQQLGGQRLGASLYEVHPGERTFPYHYEYGAEEWALVLAGRPTLRHPGGEDELEPGDVVCFPDGPEGAHKFTNRGEETARVMILSTYDRPAVAVYPDSDKLGVWSDGEDDVLIVRRESAVDYWHGER